MTDTVASLYRDFVLPMTPGQTISELLDATLSTESQAPKIAEIIEKNPLYAHYLQRLDILKQKVQQWRQDFPEDKSTERLTKYIVVLLGPAIVRNTVLAVWLSRQSAQGLPTKDGTPYLVMPANQLKFAVKMSEYCEEKAISHSQMAYLGALCFDWMAVLLERKGGTAKAEKKYLDELWPEALAKSRLAYEFACIPKKMELSRYVIPSVLLIELGKVAMAAHFAKGEGGGMGWKDFVKHCDSHGEKALLAYDILEDRKFPWTHAEAASLFSTVFHQLIAAEKAIRYYSQPSVLKGFDKNSYELSLVLNAAYTAHKGGIKAISPAQKAALSSQLKITDQNLADAFARVKGKGK